MFVIITQILTNYVSPASLIHVGKSDLHTSSSNFLQLYIIISVGYQLELSIK